LAAIDWESSPEAGGQGRFLESSVLPVIRPERRFHSHFRCFQRIDARTPQAFVFARSAKDAQLEAAAQNGIGDSYRAQGQSEKALGSYQQALELATGVDDEKGQAARWVKRLLSDCGVELCVIVQVIFDDLIALA
jgi:tetratricopeptide (TPR) repeat protein